MPIIGDTQLQPVNILGQFVQGMEMGRSARAARQQEAYNALKMQQAQREADDANALRMALSRGAPDDELMRTPGGAAFLEQRFKAQGAQATARGTELGNREKAATLLASQAGAFLRNPAALNKATLAPWVAQSVASGLLSPEAAAAFDSMPDDPQLLTQGLQQVQMAALTPAQQTEQTFTSQNLGGQMRVLATPTRGGGPATVVPGSQAAVTMSPYEQARIGLERQQEARLSAQEARLSAPPSQAEPPAKLKPGERWNPEAQRIEAVPGSELYIKQTKAHAADFNVARGIDTQRNLANAKIDALLNESNTSAFNKLFGGYNAYATQMFSGKTANLKSQLDSLRSSLKTAGLQLIRQGSGGSIGQITEREWPILEGMIDTLTPTMQESEARRRLGEIRTFMDHLAEKADEKYEMTYADSPFYKGHRKSSGASGDWTDL